MCQKLPLQERAKHIRNAFESGPIQRSRKDSEPHHLEKSAPDILDARSSVNVGYSDLHNAVSCFGVGRDHFLISIKG